MAFHRVGTLAFVAALVLAAPSAGRAGGTGFTDEDISASDGPAFFGFVREVGGPGVPDAKVTAGLLTGLVIRRFATRFATRLLDRFTPRRTAARRPAVRLVRVARIVCALHSQRACSANVLPQLLCNSPHQSRFITSGARQCACRCACYGGSFCPTSGTPTVLPDDCPLRVLRRLHAGGRVK